MGIWSLRTEQVDSCAPPKPQSISSPVVQVATRCAIVPSQSCQNSSGERCDVRSLPPIANCYTTYVCICFTRRIDPSGPACRPRSCARRHPIGVVRVHYETIAAPHMSHDERRLEPGGRPASARAAGQNRIPRRAGILVCGAGACRVDRRYGYRQRVSHSQIAV